MIPGLKSGIYTIQVYLLFGFYPSIDGTQPCKRAVCDIETDFDPKLQFSYELIKPSLNVKILPVSSVKLLAQDLSVMPSTSLTECSDYTSLSGFWHNESFLSHELACALPNSLEMQHVLSTDIQKSRVTWIHVLGDSLVRHAVLQLINELGLSHAYNYTKPAAKYPTHIIAAGRFQGNRTVIITWRWWFRIISNEQVVSLSPLEIVLDPSRIGEIFSWETLLQQFPDSQRPPFALEPHHKPDYIFVGLGSHSSSATVSGIESHWKTIESLLASAFHDGRRVSLLGISPADSARAKPRAQALVRNDATIRAHNAFMKHKAEQLGIPFLDWYSMISGTEWDLYKDCLHPDLMIQKQQGRSMFGQFVREKLTVSASAQEVRAVPSPEPHPL
ncbi:MAG: hypothetical protein CYPHOPRED_005461 [Cyphobasidiales sp. Tagirdzhanova-0007]|nr:MAG: hypothetical protein CYPHOPRED_005461 [Cyphobasidiales sp. Tagirdzhanova-0007]